MSAPCVSFDCTATGKLSTAQAIRGIYAEAFRRPMPSGLAYTENVDPRRSGQNITWHNPRWAPQEGDIPDYMGAIHTLMEERAPGRKHRKLRKDAVLVRSLVYQVSPVYFFPDLKTWSQRDIELSRFEERGRLDMERVESWKKVMFSYLKEKYGDALLSMELHLDETSPHLHVQMVPVTKDGRLSSKELFTEHTIKQQLDELAKVCTPLGIERATEGGKEGRLNKKPDEWEKYRERERAKDIAESRDSWTIEKIPKEFTITRPIMPEKPKHPGIFASDDEKEAYQNQMENYKDSLRDYEEQSSPEWRSAEQKKRILWRLNSDAAAIQSLRDKVKSAQQDAKKARIEAKRYQNELKQIEAATLKAIPLSDVMERCYPGKFYQDGDKTIWKSEDGRKIGITGQLFIDNHDGSFKGKGAIDFVMKIDSCTVKEAIGKLRDYFGTTEVLRHIAAVEPRRLAPVIDSAPHCQEPPAPAPDPQKTPLVRAWMTRDLRISPETATYLLTTGQVYADSLQNCVVPRPNGGCFMRGTVKLKNGLRNTFKRTLGSKKAGAGILQGPQATPQNQSILCEGITDALALVDIYPDANVYIIAGNLYPDLPPLSEPIYLAFDTDAAGDAHTAHYQAMYPDATPLTPPYGQDWSDYHQQEAEREAEEERRYAPTPKPR